MFTIRKALPVILILCLGFIIYSNTFSCGFHFDDTLSIVENSNIKNINRLDRIWAFWPSRFITYLSVALNYYFGKLDVVGYHIFNIGVHLLTASLVYWFVLLIFSTVVMRQSILEKHKDNIALFAAFIFVAHPVQTQAVTYIIQRAASLCAMFYLLSLCLYFKSRLSSNFASSFKFFCFSVIACLFAMFTKEIAITLPFMILLCERYFFFTPGQQSDKNILSRRVVFFAAFVVIPFTILFAGVVDLTQMTRVSEGPLCISYKDYLFTQFRVIVTYIRLLFFPLNQNLDYNYPVYNSIVAPPVFLSLLFIVSLVVWAIKLFPKHRLLSFSLLWFFITIFPESGLIPIRDVIFEHRLYLPIVGFAMLLPAGLYYLLGKKLGTQKIVMILAVFIIACSILTYKRNFVWRDNFTLLEDITKKSSNKARAFNDRGNAYASKGDFTRAIADFNKVIEISRHTDKKAQIYEAMIDRATLAVAYSNKGLVYLSMGNFEEAIKDFSSAIEANPMLEAAYYNRGIAYASKGDRGKAASDFTKTIELNPKNPAAYNARGILYAQESDFDAAESDFIKAIEFQPDDANNYNNLGNVYLNKKDIQKAILNYSRAIELNLNFAITYINRSKAYFENKEYDRALKDAQTARNLGYELPRELSEKLKSISLNSK